MSQIQLSFVIWTCYLQISDLVLKRHMNTIMFGLVSKVKDTYCFSEETDCVQNMF